MKAGKLERNKTIFALASHFGVAKKKLLDTVDNSQDIINFDGNEYLGDIHFAHDFYAVGQVKISFFEMLKYDKFLKTTLFDTFINVEGMSEQPILLTFELGTTHMCLYRSSSYSGFGGIFLRHSSQISDSADEGSFVIEPLTSFLRHTYPRNID